MFKNIAFSLFCFYYCQSFGQTVLSHNVGEDIVVTDIYSCSWGDVYWARTFILQDFGINPGDSFTIFSGRVAINPNNTAWDSRIQFNIYSISDKFPETAGNLLGSSQIEDVWMIPGPYYTMNFDSPVTVPGYVDRILVEVHQLPSNNSEAHLFCSGTAADDDVSWFKTGSLGCNPAEYTDTAGLGHPNARFYITVNTTANTMDTGAAVKNDFQVYPNPATNVLNVTEGYFNSYSMVNTCGQVVAKGSYTSQISLENFNKGVYLLILESADGKTSTHKVVKK